MRSENEKLVALVKKRPEIYDRSLMNYSNRRVTNKYWNEIAKEMKSTVAICKDKWAHLRTACARHLKEGKFTTQGRPRRKWYLAKKIQFLEKHIYNYNQEMASNPVDNRSEIDHQNISSTSQKSKLEDSDASSDSEEKTRSMSDVVIDPEYILTKRKNEDDPDSLFFKSMLADYKNLTQKRMRHFRESMVITLNKLQEEDEDDEAAAHVCRNRSDSIIVTKYEEGV